MLRRHHGAFSLGRFFHRPFMTVMASFSGTSSLATDAMRSFGALLGRPSLTIARPSSQSRNRIWNPNHGIIFGNNASTMPKSPRLARMISSTSIDEDPAIHSSIEDSYVLSAAIESQISASQASTASEIKAGTNLEENSWAPSAASASQISEIEERNEEVLSEQETVMEHVSEEAIGSSMKETHTPLSFKIPKEILKLAKDAPSGSKDSFWSHKLYRGPADSEVKVHYCRSKHTTNRVAEYFVNEKVLGFDIEWKPEASRNSGIKKNVALIQIASEERIALFHIALYPGDTVDALVAPTLKKIMENPDISKVGVAIKADCTRLRNFLQIDPKGILELSHLYKLVKYSTSGDVDKINKKLVSLATQVDEHLQLPISKGDVRGSDWTQALSMDQIIYAAADSYANFMLFDSLEAKRKQLNPCPPRPYHAELNLPIRLATGAEIPTADEAIEDPEASASVTNGARVISTTHPASALEAAAENVQIESEDDSDPSYIPAPKPRLTTKPKAAKETKEATTQPPKTQAIMDAEAWASHYREANPAVKSSRMPPPTFAALRAYALWHNNPALSLTQIASALREPPLRPSTVSNYILEVVRVEKVPFQKDRLVEVFDTWPDGGKAWRYKGLRDRIGIEEQGI